MVSLVLALPLSGILKVVAALEDLTDEARYFVLGSPAITYLVKDHCLSLNQFHKRYHVLLFENVST
jgi:hypothetical protein